MLQVATIFYLNHPKCYQIFFFSCKCTFFCCRQRDKLEDMLRDLTPERAKIARCMVFCVNHADCAEEVN